MICPKIKQGECGILESAVTVNQSSEFKKGLHGGVSIAIGYMPVALTFGLIAKSTGLSLAEAVMMSLIVYAGAAQYISLSLLAQGIGILEIILTTFIVNIRHFLMSASLNEKTEPDRALAKVGYAFGITDETFSVAALRRGTITTGFMYGLTLISYSSWALFTAVGFAAGAALPQTLQESMSIALYAMFIGLLVPSMRGSMKVLCLAAASALLNAAFTLSGLMSTGWSIVTATLLVSILSQWTENWKGGSGR